MRSRFTISQAIVEKGRPRKYLRIMESGKTWSIADLAAIDGSDYSQAKQAITKLVQRGFIGSNSKSSKYVSAVYQIAEAGFNELEEANELLLMESHQVMGETMVNRTIRTQPASVWALGAQA